jgi:ribosomal protein L21E
MNKFVAGAHVKHKRHPEYGFGRVVYVHPNSKSLAVVFENRTGLTHDCAGHGKADFSRWSRAESLTSVVPFKAGDTVSICAEEVRSDRSFYYDPNYAGKTGSVISVDDRHALVTVKGHFGSQYIPHADLTALKVDPVEAVKAATPKVKTITFKKGSQCDRLVKYMLSGNSVTPIKARSLFGAERLAARILEIKKAGHKVKTVIKTDLNGKVYAEYSLRNVGRVAA